MPKDVEEASVEISVVVPLFSEDGNVRPLIERLLNVLNPMKLTFEIILVDDGSLDGTWGTVEKEGRDNPQIKAIQLSRNFGHQHALLAGLSNCKGRAVISMDGDLQHPPEAIPSMVEKWQEGYEIVNTYRDDSDVSTVFKRFTSKYFYKLFSLMAEVDISEGSSDFRLVDRIVLQNMLGFRDVDLFLRGASQWLGFSKTTIPYKAEARFSGESKYGLWKMIQFSRAAIVSFSTKPLILSVWIGFITSILALIELFYIVIQYFMGNTITGWASTLGVLSLLFGVLFVILGIIGTYIARIHTALQNRPRFVVQKMVNFD